MKNEKGGGWEFSNVHLELGCEFVYIYFAHVFPSLSGAVGWVLAAEAASVGQFLILVGFEFFFAKPMPMIGGR